MKRTLLSLLAATMFFMSSQAAVETGKTYRIVPAGHVGKSLFVRNSSLTTNTAVVVWTETDVPAQQWTAMAGTDETITLRNVYTGHYLGLQNGLLVQTASPTQWTIEFIDEATNTCLIHSNGSYLVATGFDDDAQPTAGTTPQQWQMVETNAQTELTEGIRQRMLDGFLLQYLQDKGNGHRTFINGGWSESETQEALLDIYEATGDRSVLTIFEACYDLLKYHVGNYWNSGTQIGGYNWYGYDFNDDVMWQIIVAARAYHLTGKRTYLDDAKRNFDAIWNRAYLGYVGLLRWAENSGDRNSANSCVNGPAEVAACYIATGLGDESYFEKAKELYTNQRKYLYEPATGKVYDNVVFDPTTATVKSSNTWASTYNQGTMLGAAVLLYRHYGDEMYRQDAERIIGYSRSNLCNTDGIIHVCQNVDGDLQGFKGILMRYAGLYVSEFDDNDYKEWIVRNAMHAYCNQNSSHFGHSAWLTKANENLLQGGVNYGVSGCAFGASTALSAAYAVRLTDQYVPIGESTSLEAEDGVLSGNAEVRTDAVTGGRFVGGLDNGAGYVRLTYQSPLEGDYMIDVYYVSAQTRDLQITAGTRRVTISCPSVGTWDNLSCEGKVSTVVSMRAGTINIMLTNPNGNAPNVDRIVITPIRTTKENNTLNTTDATEHTSNRMVFTYMADRPGHYQARVSYKTDDNRSMYIAVNGSNRASQSYNNTNGYINVRPLFVTLRQGENTIELGNDNATMPEVVQVELVYLAPVATSLEAEHAQSSGTVSIQRHAQASGGEYMGNIGQGAANTLTFYYDADEAGDYDLTISYFTAANRSMYHQVNSGEKVRRTYGDTGSWNASQPAGTKTVTVTLQYGLNAITLGNDDTAAPNVDKIELTKKPAADGIQTPRSTTAATDAWFTLDGRHIKPGKQGLRPGIYLHGGKKVIIPRNI